MGISPVRTLVCIPQGIRVIPDEVRGTRRTTAPTTAPDHAMHTRVEGLHEVLLEQFRDEYL